MDLQGQLQKLRIDHDLLNEAHEKLLEDYHNIKQNSLTHEELAALKHENL